MLIAKGAAHALLFICPKLRKSWQLFHPRLILFQVRMVAEHSVGVRETVHVVEEFKH